MRLCASGRAGAWSLARLMLFGSRWLLCSPGCRPSISPIFGFEVNRLSPALLGILPFLLTVVVLIGISFRARHRPSPAPAALTLPYRREER